jgi:hypothetical protein
MPRSPKVTSPDFNFCCCFKDIVYVYAMSQALRQLGDRIRGAVMNVIEDMLRRVCDETAFGGMCVVSCACEQKLEC